MDERKVEGYRVEGLVADELERRGYSVVARNFAKRCGELDIVAVREREVVVCEVRSRRTGSLDDATESVNALKRQKLRATASAFLSGFAFPWDEVRFFVAAAVTADGRTVIEIYEDAF